MAASSEPRALSKNGLGAVRRVLQIGLFVVLMLPGLDEVQYFFSRKWFITDWNDYVAPIVLRTVGLDRDILMLIVGVAQIVVAVLILVRPRAGAFVACAGFCLIIANLLLHSAYDIVIRDFGLFTAALALAIAAKNVSVRAPVSAETSTPASTGPTS